MSSTVREFVFNGIIARRAVQDMEAGGLLRQPRHVVGEARESDLFAPVQDVIRNNSLHMQYAFRLMYVLENTVRELITSRFTEQDGPDWFEHRASAAMKGRVDKRRETEAKNQWHTGRNKESVFYLDFGDLGKLIINHWDSFQDLLPSQSWVQSRMDDAEKSRNVVAHTNVLASEEIDRLEICLRDWIRQTG